MQVELASHPPASPRSSRAACCVVEIMWSKVSFSDCFSSLSTNLFSASPISGAAPNHTLQSTSRLRSEGRSMVMCTDVSHCTRQSSRTRNNLEGPSKLRYKILYLCVIQTSWHILKINVSCCLLLLPTAHRATLNWFGGSRRLPQVKKSLLYRAVRS
jgi:hypothetical protein